MTSDHVYGNSSPGNAFRDAACSLWTTGNANNPNPGSSPEQIVRRHAPEQTHNMYSNYLHMEGW